MNLGRAGERRAGGGGGDWRKVGVGGVIRHVIKSPLSRNDLLPPTVNVHAASQPKYNAYAQKLNGALIRNTYFGFDGNDKTQL